MKNLLRGSLLAVLFVGMSGFSSDSLQCSDQSFVIEEDPERVGRDCNREANARTRIIKAALPALTDSTLGLIWFDIVMACKKDSGDE
ncbi:MAG: hypothetical protein WBA16_02905 [Nonlabens sp.]